MSVGQIQMLDGWFPPIVNNLQDIKSVLFQLIAFTTLGSIIIKYYYLQTPVKKVTAAPMQPPPPLTTTPATPAPSARLVTLTPVSPPKFVPSPQRKPEPAAAVISVAASEAKRVEKPIGEMKMCRVCNAPVRNFKDHLRNVHKLNEQVEQLFINI
jgi:hypothetical protein